MNDFVATIAHWGTCSVCAQELPLQMPQGTIARHSGSEGFFGPYCTGSLQAKA